MKNKINYILFIVLNFLLGSCTKKLYFGTYQMAVQHLSYESFVINSDSTFVYEYREGEWNSNNSEGKWLRKDNNLILNSTYKSNSLPIDVKNFRDSTIANYQFTFNDFYSPKENPGLWQNLIINDTFKIKVIDSIINVKYTGKIKRVKIEIVGTQLLTDTSGMYKLLTTNYITQDEKANIFIIDYYFNGNMLRYKDFNNEQLKIKCKTIYWPAKKIKYSLK